MIVVVGTLVYGPPGEADHEVAGRTGAIARAAVAAGGTVQVVGKIGEDGAGDALVVALGRERIGHAALLRDPARSTPVVAPRPAPRPDEAPDEAPDADGAQADGAPAGPAILPADAADRPAIEAADLELALRYLPGIGTIVAADPLDASLAAVVATAASFAGAQLVAIVGEDGAAVRDAYGDDATLLAAPPEDEDEGFAQLVGTYAAGLDAGRDPAEAFRAATAGWEHAEPA